MSGFVQASFDAPTASLIGDRTIIGKRHIVLIQKRGFGGVALLLMDDGYAVFFAFGGKLLFEFVIGNGDKVLVVRLADVDALLASAKVSEHDGSYVVFDGVLNDMLDGKIEEVVDAVVSFEAQGYEVARIFVSLPIVDGLQVGFALVEVAVDGFDRAPVYDKSATATWIASRKVVDAKVDGKIVAMLSWLWYSNFIDKFDIPHLTSKAWNEAKLFDFKPKLFGKSFFNGYYHIALFDSCASALDRDAHIERFAAFSLFLISWQMYLIAIFTLVFELQKPKEASHIPIDKSHYTLGYVAQEHLVARRGFDPVVVRGVVQILAVLEVVWTHAVKSLVIESCASKTHSFDSLHLGGFELKAISLRAYCFHTHITLKSNERRK